MNTPADYFDTSAISLDPQGRVRVEVHWQDNGRYRLDHPRSVQVFAIVDGTFLGRYLHPKEMRRVRDQVEVDPIIWTAN